MKVHTLTALNDNYIFILVDELSREAVVVDPALPDVVIDFIKNNNLKLTKILNTHHHCDHVDGNSLILKEFPNVEVCAGINDSGRVPFQTHFLKHGDIINCVGESAQIFYVPGHTLGHICYFFSLKDGENHLFIGDTIFSGGCGKIFEGTYYQMYQSINFLIKNLPDSTYIWCTHEYTLENYLYLEKLEPENIRIKQKIKDVKELRKQNKATIPFTLGSEKILNSFLRSNDPSLKFILNANNDFEIFCKVRQFRDKSQNINADIEILK
jgi:hydroxyacylglutathione hydrolase